MRKQMRWNVREDRKLKNCTKKLEFESEEKFYGFKRRIREKKIHKAIIDIFKQNV